MSIVTLLTDFGDSDEYVGVMKGTILSIAPETAIVDLTHKIAPQDIAKAAWMIKAAYRYFPKGTVHVVVVDPGVGSDRKIAALKIDGHYFLAPDNGVLSLLWSDRKTDAGAWVENRRYFLSEISRTFHGRDIFAPVAARLSRNLPLEKLGPVLETSRLETLKIGPASISSQNIVYGIVVSIDRFGNLITNIEEKTVLELCGRRPGKSPAAIIGDGRVRGLSTSYQSVPEKQPLMIIGSRGLLEIAVNRGAADTMFNAAEGDSITVVLMD